MNAKSQVQAGTRQGGGHPILPVNFKSNKRIKSNKGKTSRMNMCLSFYVGSYVQVGRGVREQAYRVNCCTCAMLAIEPEITRRAIPAGQATVNVSGWAS